MVTEYYLIVFPIYGQLSELTLGRYGIKVLGFNSPEFQAILNHQQMDRIGVDVKRSLSYVTAYNLEESCQILMTRTHYQNLDLVFNILSFLKPSTIKPVAELRINYVTRNGKKTLFQITSVRDNNIHMEKAYDQALHLFNDGKSFHLLFDKYLQLGNRTNLYKLFVLYYEGIHINRDHLKLINLTMIIETLLGEDKDNGISYKIRRTCAVLLGDNVEMCLQIEKNMKKVYAARSLLVHNADLDAAKENVIIYLHTVVCEILSTLLITGMQYKDTSEVCKLYGYGQRKELLGRFNVTKDVRVFTNQSRLRRAL